AAIAKGNPQSAPGGRGPAWPDLLLAARTAAQRRDRARHGLCCHPRRRGLHHTARARPHACHFAEPPLTLGQGARVATPRVAQNSSRCQRSWLRSSWDVLYCFFALAGAIQIRGMFSFRSESLKARVSLWAISFQRASCAATRPLNTSNSSED